MNDSRRPDNPFERGPFERGRRRSSNGIRPHGVDSPTTPIRSLRHTGEEPIDLLAVQADDELINALAAGLPVAGSAAAGADDRVIAMLAAWRADVDADPVPELIDLDAAVAAVRAPRSRARRRHLAPLVGAAALVVFAGTGVAAAAQTAQPGDVLWGVTKVLHSERASSVEAAVEVRSGLERARTAMASGATAMAAQELAAVEAELATIREEEGQSALSGEQQRLAAKLGETPPGTPTDPDAPLTTAPGTPPPAAKPATPEEPAPTEPPATDPTAQPDPIPEPTQPPGTSEGDPEDVVDQPTGGTEGSAEPTTTAGEAQPSSSAGTVPPGTPSASGTGTSSAPTSTL